MSLILEALRKSEAERRRAQMPDLLTESPVAAPVAARAPQRWPWMAAGVVVVLGAAWFVTRTPAPAVAAVQDDAATATLQAPPVQATATAAIPAAKPATPARRPLVVAPPPPAMPTPAIEPPPATQVAAATPPPPPTPAPARVEPAPIAASPPAFDTVQRITDLGSEERKQLPPLKLTMHMWNDVAAQRFVIIDGTRLSVGDRLGGLVVADIVPDGVVLDWNGRALKLPLR